jgi:hypothetical protein
MNDDPLPDLNDDEKALVEEMPELTGVGPTRREFLRYTIAGNLGFLALDLRAQEKALARSHVHQTPPSPRPVRRTWSRWLSR